MSIVSNICITSESGQQMEVKQSVEVLANKGILQDRYFNEINEKDTQITLIESENVEYINKSMGINFLDIDFRRNIITKGIKLNQLVGKKIKVGQVTMKVHRLCDPCRYLQDLLNQKNLIKTLLNKGGLRCELLTDGKISINDNIEVL
jgi:MOSC domain-containing protein YiiM